MGNLELAWGESGGNLCKGRALVTAKISIKKADDDYEILTAYFIHFVGFYLKHNKEVLFLFV